MNRLLAVFAVLTVCGCMSTETGTRVTTPEEVCASFVAEVIQLASEYPELADFPAYVESSEAVSKGVYFLRCLPPIKGPRTIYDRIKPSDFDKHGIDLRFALVDYSEGELSVSAPNTPFPHLKLALLHELHLWEGAPPELGARLKEIMGRHKGMLSELDKKAANKPDAGDGK